MMLRARLGRVAAISIFASFLATGAACSKPKDPQLTPQEAKVTSVDMITKLDSRVAADITRVMRDWQYAPYKLNGTPTAACFVVSFKLK